MQDLILDVVEQLYRANEVFAARAHECPTNKNRDIRPQGAVKIANMAKKKSRTAPLLVQIWDVCGISDVYLLRLHFEEVLSRPGEAEYLKNCR